VRELLEFIGYDPIAVAKSKDQIEAAAEQQDEIDALEDYWSANPHAMEQAKRQGPREIQTQKRMVAINDYALRLREHPLVADAHAWTEWSGSWFTLHLAVIAAADIELDSSTSLDDYGDDMQLKISNFHERLGLRSPDFEATRLPSMRMILRPYIDAFRMAGQEVIMRDPFYVGIYMSISVKVGENFFQSEIRHEIARALGQGPDGFFRPGKHGFGEDLYASDVIEALMAIDGIKHVCLNRFKRIGNQFHDRVEAGFIILDGLEVARCDNQPGEPKQGYYRLMLHGGRKG
jgi:hypothetical protein